ncbi:hypothetical protein PHET_12249 [Paragonimus heterotremus]|uniref:Uncharacterized protein n=1 Tax=Paragonimus heterotremus TaxID=100268 RepID=A0A8J4SID2_9TREM|nr:hypothetical protein PHET_12249 [Paragonimus heterotremus]
MAHPGSSSVAHFLETVVLCSEKAATIARLIRTHSLFDTLIQRKCAKEANARFDIDLKTLADVLIQEGIRYDLEKMVGYVDPFLLDVVFAVWFEVTDILLCTSIHDLDPPPNLSASEPLLPFNRWSCF